MQDSVVLYSFTIGFYLGGKLFLNNRYFNTLSALIVGFVIYFISGYILTRFSINIFSGFMIFLVAMFITILFSEELLIISIQR
ncbi:hypothetical protein [Francisella orientalis]|uniref:hypothetical protein n=1 Tax=Francisella orientalis TaxID=299583 RepID=UPI001F1F6AD3|nr:hypothetical protein [Francisella orientalis]